MVQVLVIVRADVTARECFFQMAEERHIHGHNVLEMTVLRAVLYHQNLAIAFNNLRLDLSDTLIEQNFMRKLPVKNLLADLRDAFWAQRIGSTRPA
jgi:hypothetical protein